MSDSKKKPPLISAIRNFLNDSTIYKPDDIDIVVKSVLYSINNVLVSKYDHRSKQSIQYYNIPCSFDIETSSFYDRGEKVSIMYEWSFSFCGMVMIGRTWSEFISMIDRLHNLLRLTDTRRLIIYCHNLAFEFQAMRFYFQWKSVFALSVRRPVYAVTDMGIEFRCSYILTNANLATVGKNLIYFDVKKMVGDLDYSLIRHSETPLTEQEIQYCINDVQIVVCLIAERILQDGNITRIPLTQTGYIRRLLRKNCLSKQNRCSYNRLMRRLTLTMLEYEQLRRAFQGGFTHCNPFYSGKTINDTVVSYDFTSSYPTVMISEQYPMSAAELIPNISYDEFKKSMKYYCCVFDIEFINISPKIWQDNPISISRCWDIRQEVVNNGRLVSAEHVCTTITSIDFDIISKFYRWDSYRIANFRRYKRGYLPKPIIETVLQLYADKTTLKNVVGKENEYMNKKECLNSCYGCMVMNVLQEEHTYSDDWDELQENYNSEMSEDECIQKIEEYNNDKNRFLFYPWGVFITAYARWNLFTGIYECAKSNDYIYADTDSIKLLNVDSHSEYFEKYNNYITQKLEKTIEFYGLNPNLLHPKTIDGIEKPLGIWDFDGKYKKFKSLGAKRYMVEYENGVHSITVAGLGKKSGTKYLEQFGDQIFDKFSKDLTVPPEHSGRSTHTYIDILRHGAVTDYMGNSATYYEMSGTHLENSEYNLSISSEYAAFLFGLVERGEK